MLAIVLFHDFPSFTPRQSVAHLSYQSPFEHKVFQDLAHALDFRVCLMLIAAQKHEDGKGQRHGRWMEMATEKRN